MVARTSTATTRRRKSTGTVSARTAKRRAAKLENAQSSRRADARNAQGPETLAQARAWGRKFKRYRRLGLCNPCASQAAWGHQLGFGKVHDPCVKCQPIVDQFPESGPRGSKWRKCLIKVEYLTKAEAREMGLI